MQANATLNSKAGNLIFLAAITQNEKDRKKMNNKVQIFELEESDGKLDAAISDGETGH